MGNYVAGSVGFRSSSSLFQGPGTVHYVRSVGSTFHRVLYPGVDVEKDLWMPR
jgi:hypothetical protein